jgi:hypothetical protein
VYYSSGTSTEILTDTGTTLVDDQWYHIGFTFSNSTKAWRIRVWDDTGSSVAETTGTATNVITATTAPVNIGGQDTVSQSNGYYDEVVVFNDILTTGEIDAIRAGTYSSVPTLEVTCDASLLATVTHEVTCDAILIKAVTVTCDAVLSKQQTHTVTCDAILTKKHEITCDAILTKRMDVTCDAHLVLANSMEVTCDAQLEKLINVTCDANLYNPADYLTFPTIRPVSYDADKVYDEDTKSWYNPTTSTGVERMKQAGGRYRSQLVVLSDQGKIYFEDY